MLFQQRAIGIAAAVLLGFAMIPGLPTMPFMILSLSPPGWLWHLQVRQEDDQEAVSPSCRKLTAPPAGMENLLPLDILALEVGYGLIPLVDADQSGNTARPHQNHPASVGARARHRGPPIHIQDNMQLKPGEYPILLKGNGITQANPGEPISRDEPWCRGEKGRRDADAGADLRSARRMDKRRLKEKAIADGYTVVNPATVMTTHFSDVITRHAHELVGRQEVQALLDNLKDTHPKVVEELMPNLLPLGAVVRVLQNLLKEQIPIRDLLAILETLADWTPMTKEPTS